jgi:3-hydroxybutyryl-CoA dehydrogenase
MGPFQLMDLVGLDTVLPVLESLQANYGERFRPPQLLRQMVAAGKLGRKSGAGFYDYPKKEKSS